MCAVETIYLKLDRKSENSALNSKVPLQIRVQLNCTKIGGDVFNLLVNCCTLKSNWHSLTYLYERKIVGRPLIAIQV